MIANRTDLANYLEEDARALGKTGRPFPLRGISDKNDIWLFQVLLRKAEYHTNAGHGLRSKWYRLRLNRLGSLLGFTIPLNTCGKGLSIVHVGTIVISRFATLGEYCRIHAGVNIGVAAGSRDEAPRVGSRVYIGPGAKLYGSIVIGDDVAIGANAVCNKSYPDSGVSIAGIPAKIISRKGSKGLLYAPCDL